MVKAHRFATGKIPSEILRKLVFNRLGVPSDRILQGPNVGEDAAVINMGEKVLVVATDPITGAIGNVGWLVVHVNANDVASTGAKPIWFLCVALLPEGAGEDLLDSIMVQMHDACMQVGASLIGGHTETTPGLDRPILVGFMMGEVEKSRYVTTGGAKPGDDIILTKGAGIEGTGVLAGDLSDLIREKVSESVLRSAMDLLRQISVVPEALTAVEVGGVHSLHDPTEGGLLNGVWEMTEAAGVGVRIHEDAINIYGETIAICNALDADPLKLMGSGALIIVTEPEKVGEMITKIRDLGIAASVIGKITPLDEGRVLIKKDGSRVAIEAVDQDEVYRLLDKHSPVSQ